MQHVSLLVFGDHCPLGCRDRLLAAARARGLLTGVVVFRSASETPRGDSSIEEPLEADGSPAFSGVCCHRLAAADGHVSALTMRPIARSAAAMTRWLGS